LGGERQRIQLRYCQSAFPFAACSTEQAKPPRVKFSGFLGDYTQIEPTGNSSEAFLCYLDLSTPRSSGATVGSEPVAFRVGPDSKISARVRHTPTGCAYRKFAAALAAKAVRLTGQDGTGVHVARAALTEADQANFDRTSSAEPLETLPIHLHRTIPPTGRPKPNSVP
jgi:Protein of unknown function (DUF3313)